VGKATKDANDTQFKGSKTPMVIVLSGTIRPKKETDRKQLRSVILFTTNLIKVRWIVTGEGMAQADSSPVILAGWKVGVA